MFKGPSLRRWGNNAFEPRFVSHGNGVRILSWRKGKLAWQYSTLLMQSWLLTIPQAARFPTWITILTKAELCEIKNIHFHAHRVNSGKYPYILRNPRLLQIRLAIYVLRNWRYSCILCVLNCQREKHRFAFYAIPPYWHDTVVEIFPQVRQEFTYST